VPVKDHWPADAIMAARASDACGRLAKTLVEGVLPKIPACHIWKKRPKVPATIGVDALVPPKLEV